MARVAPEVKHQTAWLIKFIFIYVIQRDALDSFSEESKFFYSVFICLEYNNEMKSLYIEHLLCNFSVRTLNHQAVRTKNDPLHRDVHLF